MDLKSITAIDLRAHWDATSECLNDTVAQHNSETAQFGDSWPGAQVEIAEARRQLAGIETEMKRRGWQI